MLCLSRKPGEFIQIGDDIVIHFSEVRDNKVRLAIDAPKSVAIVRGELLRNTDVVTDELVGDGSPATEGT